MKTLEQTHREAAEAIGPWWPRLRATYWGGPPAVYRWVATLSAEQLKEGGWLLHASRHERRAPAGVVQDWIEEHGGDRGWIYGGLDYEDGRIPTRR